MKKRLIFVFSIAAVLTSALFVSCTKRQSTVWENPIGIIGAMDSEVNSLKESAISQRQRRLQRWSFV